MNTQSIETIAGIAIPDTPLVREVTDYIRAAEDDLLFDHSRRVFLFGALQGRRRGLQPDLELLYVGAMFHDIGKAKIPLAILDKPGRLDTKERALVETHPAAGYDALKGTPAITTEVLDAVRHHHEFLDGSGYPDGLMADSIPDLTRILTISDIFSALIEYRSYKPVMARDKAYEILQSMEGKLEKPLIGAFRDVALIR